MKTLIVQIVVKVLQAVHLFFKPLKLKPRVAIISRQADEPTLDICLLSQYLESIEVETIVLTKTLKKSFRGIISYAIQLFVQMYYISTSKVIVLDGYCILISILPKKKNQRVVQMWHALGAIKKFGWQSVDNPDGHSQAVAETMKMHRNYDYVLAPGELTADIFSEAFRTPKDKFVYLGLPRIDFLRMEDHVKTQLIETAYPQIKEKINVLYVPTFRKNAAVEMERLIAGFDFSKMNFIIKKHFLDRGDYSWAEKAGAIVDQSFSSMEWLKICDKVITDYSAIAFEAAILDLDLYIFQPDASDYEHNVGLNINLREEAIGQYVCVDEEALYTVLQKPYEKPSVRAFCKKYIEFEVDGCTERLGHFIVDLIKE